MDSPYIKYLAVLACCIFTVVFTQQVSAGTDTIGKWQRHVISIHNNSYDGNPFELPLGATFTHVESGSTIVLPGYYSGGDTWKIGFMPNEEGEWTYVTFSDDPDLDGMRGSINCIGSDLTGMLKADPDHPRKWKFTDSGYVVPIALRVEFFSEPGTLEQFITTTDFLQTHNMHLLETRLLEETGQFAGRHDFIFDGDWRDHQFDLVVWDRMEARMSALTERGLGAHIMFYSDASGKPSWSDYSETEQLVIRYVIARLASYPVVIFNSGIDIAEYRDQSWVDWFGEQIRKLDPYGHPVSSRYGGGSGDLVMSGQTFDSRGAQLATISEMTHFFETSDVPVSMDDAWGENRVSRPLKNFLPEDIRRAFWKAVLAGGLGGLIRGADGYFHISDLPDDLESEQWLKLINPFIISKLGDTFGAMVPESSLVSNGYCLADPQRIRILCYMVGRNDKWDSGGGGAVTIKLSGAKGWFEANWFDTRTGSELAAGRFEGGGDHHLKPPSKDDWVLLLSKIANMAESAQPFSGSGFQ